MRRRYGRWNCVRRQLIDDGGDHRIEIRDLVMQFEVSTSEGFDGCGVRLRHPLRNENKSPCAVRSVK